MIKKQPSSKGTFQVFSKRLIFPAVRNNNNTIRDKQSSIFGAHSKKIAHENMRENKF